jgi:transcriptional regulator with XRE-family HTH domain
MTGANDAGDAKNGEGNMSGRSSDAVDKHVGSRVRMRRLMLGLSQGKLADQVELTFQQVQKYEKGTNRIGAGRLYQLSHILDVPVSFFFEGAPWPAGLPSRNRRDTPSPDYMTAFLATANGQALVKAFMRIKRTTVRRSIVRMLEAIADEGGP